MGVLGGGGWVVEGVEYVRRARMLVVGVLNAQRCDGRSEVGVSVVLGRMACLAAVVMERIFGEDVLL